MVFLRSEEDMRDVSPEFSFEDWKLAETNS